MNTDVGGQMTTPATKILGLLIESGVFYILIGVSSGVRAQGRAVNHEFPVFLPSAHSRGLPCDPLNPREARTIVMPVAVQLAVRIASTITV
jgi:hypothetical protein